MLALSHNNDALTLSWWCFRLLPDDSGQGERGLTFPQSLVLPETDTAHTPHGFSLPLCDYRRIFPLSIERNTYHVAF